MLLFFLPNIPNRNNTDTGTASIQGIDLQQKIMKFRNNILVYDLLFNKPPATRWNSDRTFQSVLNKYARRSHLPRTIYLPRPRRRQNHERYSYSPPMSTSRFSDRTYKNHKFHQCPELMATNKNEPTVRRNRIWKLKE